MTNAEKIMLMRSHAVIAGITSLAHFYDKEVPLEDRPFQSNAYLYEAVLLAGHYEPLSAFQGLSRFAVSLLDDAISEEMLSFESVVSTDGERTTFELIRDAFDKGITAKVTLAMLKSQLDYPRGNLDDIAFYFSLRQVENTSKQYVRLGIARFLQMMLALDDGNPDWWHELGQGLNFFAHGYMAESWAATGPVLSDQGYIADDRLREAARLQRIEDLEPYERMLEQHRAELYVRLADSIGRANGHLPYDRPTPLTKVLLQHSREE